MLRKILQHCFALKFQKCFDEYEPSHDFPSAWKWLDDNSIPFLGNYTILWNKEIQKTFVFFFHFPLISSYSGMLNWYKDRSMYYTMRSNDEYSWLLKFHRANDEWCLWNNCRWLVIRLALMVFVLWLCKHWTPPVLPSCRNFNTTLWKKKPAGFPATDPSIAHFNFCFLCSGCKWEKVWSYVISYWFSF